MDEIDAMDIAGLAARVREHIERVDAEARERDDRIIGAMEELTRATQRIDSAVAGRLALMEGLADEVRKVKGRVSRLQSDANSDKLQSLIDAVALAYNEQRDEIGDSDLYDEQPLTLRVRMTLREARFARARVSDEGRAAFKTKQTLDRGRVSIEEA